MNKEEQNELNEIKLLLSSFIKEQKVFNEEQKVFNEEQKVFNEEQKVFNKYVIWEFKNIDDKFENMDKKIDKVQYYLEEIIADNTFLLFAEQEKIRKRMKQREQKMKTDIYDINQDILNINYRLA